MDWLNVSIQGAKDAPAPRPNKRPRLGPSPSEVSSPLPSTSTTSKTNPIPDDRPSRPKDAQLAEFMNVMLPRSKKGPLWKNENDQHITQSQFHNPPPPIATTTLSNTPPENKD